MPRQVRIEYEGARYHVINRGNYRKDLFSYKKTDEAFEEALNMVHPAALSGNVSQYRIKQKKTCKYRKKLEKH